MLAKSESVRSESGQFSIEFLFVIGCLLLVLASISIPMYNQARSDARRLSDLAEAREAALVLANALNSVYSGASSGPGSKQTVEYWLPKGVVEIRVNYDVDGIQTVTPAVPRNGRMDIQIWFDFDGDGLADIGDREAVVVIDTLLPSMWYENGDQRSVDEYLDVEGKDLHVGQAYGTLESRTFHRTTMWHRYDVARVELPKRLVIILDQILEEA